MGTVAASIRLQSETTAWKHFSESFGEYVKEIMAVEQQSLLGLLFLVAVTIPYVLTQGVAKLPEGIAEPPREVDDPQTDSALSDGGCTFPYTAVGQRCLFFAALYLGTFKQAYTTCHASSGELLVLDDDPAEFKSIIDAIRLKELEEIDFWIDGKNYFGNWTSKDGTTLVMGTPFWAASEDFSKPSKDNETTCAALTANYGHMISDEDCEEKTYAPICAFKPSKEAAPQPAENDSTKCPDFYVPVGGFCLAFLTWAEEPWIESRLTCESLQGGLLDLSKIELLRMIYDYLHENEIESHSFWIGGSDREEEGKWVWGDGLSIDMGTPFWGIKSNNGSEVLLLDPDTEGEVEPDGGDKENCLALTAAGKHYFRDKDCSIKMNPLCVTLPTA